MPADIDSIAAALAAHTPATDMIDASNRAAVACVLREGTEDCEVLFIRRAEFEGDPWSGHIAFPGGRVDPDDESARATAEREAVEEVGLDLAAARYLGRLDDLTGGAQSILVSGFVYALDASPRLTLNHEVRAAFWMPLATLEEPARQTEETFRYLDQDVSLPAIRVLDDGGPVLWGLTYRFIELFMQLAGRDIPGMGWRADL